MNYEELERLVKDEIVQREEEGCEVSEAREALVKIEEKNSSKLKTILNDISKLSSKSGFPYKEPSDLLGIKAEMPEGPRRIKLKISDDQLLDKILGGWLGRCAGCLLARARGSAHYLKSSNP